MLEETLACRSQFFEACNLKFLMPDHLAQSQCQSDSHRQELSNSQCLSQNLSVCLCPFGQQTDCNICLPVISHITKLEFMVLVSCHQIMQILCLAIFLLIKAVLKEAFRKFNLSADSKTLL